MLCVNRAKKSQRMTAFRYDPPPYHVYCHSIHLSIIPSIPIIDFYHAQIDQYVLRSDRYDPGLRRILHILRDHGREWILAGSFGRVESGLG